MIHADRVVELGGGESRATNNRMELLACLRAIEAWRSALGAQWRESDLQILTDSMYLIQGMTQWGWNWVRQGWPAELANRELWKELWAVRDRVGFRHVRGHSGVPGNERADAIAVAFSQGKSPALYSGGRADYPHLRAQAGTSAGNSGAAREATRESQDAALYLSLVGGVLAKHATWAECEARVKGVSGARFQKVTTYAEEAAVLAKWGVG